MSVVVDLLIRITQIAFVGLGILSLVDYLRLGGRVRRDIALMFNSLAVTIAVGIANKDLFETPNILLGLLGSLSLIAQPYLLLRLVGYLRSIPRSIDIVALVGMVASWTAVVIGGSSLPPILSLLIILYFVVIDGYAMVAFVQGALITSGVVQYRLRFAASGAGLMALALFFVGLGVLSGGSSSLVLALMTLTAIGSALTFYLGLASPKWLRQTWQLRELHRFLLQLTQDRQPETTPEILDALCRGALKATGGSRANILLRQSDIAPWTLYTPEAAGTAETVEAVAEFETYREKRAASAMPVEKLSLTSREALHPGSAESMYIVPLARDQRTWGFVLVFLDHGSLFVDDDLQMIELFAEQSAIMLENIDLIEHLRLYAETMEQQVAERTAELRASEAKYRALIEFAPDPIVISDSSGGITLVNRRAEEMFGYRQQEMIGQPLEVLLPERLRALHVVHRATYIDDPVNRAMGANLDLTALRKDGIEIPVKIGLSPIRTDAEILVMANIVDITADKQLEEGLRAALAKEKELNELKTSFTSIVSHEFRTPLSAILLATDVLTRYYDEMDRERRLEKLENIAHQAERLLKLLEDVLTFTRSDSKGFELKPTPVDLVAISQEIIEVVSAADRNHITINFEHAGECQAVVADEFLFSHILQNLASNAIKYSREEGSVQITLNCLSDAVTLRVTDHGIGIPEAYRSRLFEAFNRASNVGEVKGTGIGLTIVKRAVDAYGGTVDVDSVEGEGTTFTITLPNPDWKNAPAV